MKASLNIKFKATLLTVFLLTNVAYSEANHSIKDWFGNRNFSFVEKNDLLKVVINKNPWESFTLKIDNTNLMSNPIVNIEVASNQLITLRIDISDGVFMSSQVKTLGCKVEGNGMFYNLTYDFSETLNDVNLSKDAFLVFYVNPGKKFNGEILFKDIKFSSNSDMQQNLNSKEYFEIYPSPAKSFTNVIIPDNNFYYLAIMDITGKTIIKIDVTNYNGRTYRVDLVNFVKGNYLVQLVGADLILSTKLIIN